MIIFLNSKQSKKKNLFEEIVIEFFLLDLHIVVDLLEKVIDETK